MRSILIAVLIAAEGVFTGIDCYQKYHHQKRWFKGLLMPVIMVLYTFLFKEFRILQMLAMIAGWLGDLFLLRDEKPYFIAGCLSFMAGHILYGILYVQEIDLSLMPRPLLLSGAVYMLYAALVYRRLKSYIPSDFKGYALFYMFFITLMSFTALMRLGSVPQGSWLLIWIGSLVFMVSDTLVAFEKFVNPDLKGVMETYVPAQLLLMYGAAVH